MPHRISDCFVSFVVSFLLFSTASRTNAFDAVGSSLTSVYKKQVMSKGKASLRAAVTVSGGKVGLEEPRLDIACFDGKSACELAFPHGAKISQQSSSHVKISDGAKSAFEIFLREDSCVEWLTTLDEPPVSNALTFPFHADNLVFYFQDSLTDFENSIGAERPDSVIYSWAAYYRERSDVLRGESKYRAGKAFHIYRPKVWDSRGDTAWADLFIDTTASTMTISLDSEFMANASYPVTVDPTFGFSSVGASSTALSAAEAWGNKASQYFLVADGTEHVDSLYAYLKSYAAGTYYTDIAVYSVESGNPSQRVGSVATLSGSGSVATWRGAAVDLSLTVGNTYTLCIGNPINGTRVQYDSGTPGQNSRQTTSTQLGTDWDHMVDGTMLMSIYAVYSSGEAEPLRVTLRRHREQQLWLSPEER